MINYLHPGEWHDLSDFSNMSFTQFYEIKIQKRSKFLSRLVSLHLGEWGRIGVIKGKKHTVYSQARRIALHEFSHLEQISTSFKSTEKLIKPSSFFCITGQQNRILNLKFLIIYPGSIVN